MKKALRNHSVAKPGSATSGQVLGGRAKMLPNCVTMGTISVWQDSPHKDSFSLSSGTACEVFQ